MLEKSVTKFMKQKYRDYIRSDMYSLYDKYQCPSIAKHRAWDYCEDLCKDYNGHGLRLVGGNTMSFSAGFLCDVDGEPSYVHITKDYDRYIPLSVFDC